MIYGSLTLLGQQMEKFAHNKRLHFTC